MAKFTTLLEDEDDDSLEEKARDATFVKRRKAELAGMTPQRLHEAEYRAKVEAEQAADQERIANFGSADPMTAAQITTITNPNLAQLMQVDPEGTRAAVEREVALLGFGGAQDAGELQGPPAPGRTYRRGKGAQGEPYFTNLSDAELTEERRQTERILGIQDSKPVRNLKEIPGMQDEPVMPGRAKARTPAEALFEGKMEQALAVVEAPEKKMKRLAEVSRISDELVEVGKTKGATSAREEVVRRLTSGGFQSPQEAKAVDDFIVKHAYTEDEMVDAMAEDPFAMPWTAGGLPGVATDPAKPATIMNPGGSMPTPNRTDAILENAKMERDEIITRMMPTELPRTAQLARRTPGTPSPSRTPNFSTPFPTPETTPSPRPARKKRRLRGSPGTPGIALKRRENDSILGHYLSSLDY